MKYKFGLCSAYIPKRLKACVIGNKTLVIKRHMTKIPTHGLLSVRNSAIPVRNSAILLSDEKF